MSDRSERIAYVAEVDDAKEPGRMSGRFAANWAAVKGRGWGEGPEYVTAEEAIGWARAHATRVLVRIDATTHFSAGELPLDYDGTPLPPWPEQGVLLRPRPWRSPLDGSVQEVDWRIEAELQDRRVLGQAVAGQLRATLAADRRIGDVRISADDERTTIACAFRARNMWIPQIEGGELLRRTLRAAVPEIADEGSLLSSLRVRPPAAAPPGGY